MNSGRFFPEQSQYMILSSSWQLFCEKYYYQRWSNQTKIILFNLILHDKITKYLLEVLIYPVGSRYIEGYISPLTSIVLTLNDQSNGEYIVIIPSLSIFSLK